MARVTPVSLRAMKAAGDPIAVLTAYDYPSAAIMDEAGVDAILVGDSCANVVMGLPDTLGITLDQMIHHTTIVARAAKRSLVIGDMPFLSYQISPEEAVGNAGRFLAEAGAQAVKLEGPVDRIGAALDAIHNAGIPVMGHLGLTPQSVHELGGYGLQATDTESQEILFDQALELEAAGCFALVLEKVPAQIAERITAALSVPTVGIGAGAGCDGQVLVMHDILGLGLKAKHVRVFGDVRQVMSNAFGDYCRAVKDRAFPSEEEAY
jgi:3-methyl-2-oxobutanoate hydroxymethyltransferase